MHRTIAASLAVLLLGVPAVSATGAATETEPTTDRDAAIVPSGHVAVAELDLREDAPDLEVDTVPAVEAFPAEPAQAEAVEGPNCLHAGEDSAHLGAGALNVAGSFAPLAEAGVAEPCERNTFDVPIDSLVFATDGDEPTKLQLVEYAGFIGIGGILTIDCEGTAATVGSIDDAQAVSCELTNNGAHPSEWGNWDGQIIHDGPNATSYANVQTA